MKTKFKLLFSLVSLTVFLIGTANAAGPYAAPADEDDISTIIKKVFPAVVKVEAVNGLKKVATGVVIDKDGHIITTALISGRDGKIRVTDSDGKKYEAEFLGMDSITHLALIRAKSKNLVPVKIKTKGDVISGAWIGVLGISPEGTPAIMQGIISSVAPDKLRLNVWIVRGMSGSPVVDREGRLIGLLRGTYMDESPVVFEFRERQVVGSGYAFSRAESPASGLAVAVPAAVVKDIADEIKKKGKVERGWLGVTIVENEGGQVEIVGIDKESPAELAELKEGDIVLEFNGKEITGPGVLQNMIREKKPGQDVTVTIERKGKREKIEVKLGEYTRESIFKEFELRFPKLFPPPDELPELPRLLKSPRVPEPLKRERFYFGIEKRKFIGVYLQEIEEDLSKFFGVRKGTGLLVTRISEDSPAAEAGLKVGDVIVKAGGKRVETVSEISRLIQDKEKGEKIEIEFIRDKKTKSLEIEIDEEKNDLAWFYPGAKDEFTRLLRKYRSIKA